MAKKSDAQKVEVMVKENTSVFINGKEIKVKKGIQMVDQDVARILVEAGYAEATKTEGEQ
jgi:hypothetical protein